MDRPVYRTSAGPELAEGTRETCHTDRVASERCRRQDSRRPVTKPEINLLLNR